MVDQTIELIEDLGDGLVMRRSALADAARLADFNAKIHGEDKHDATAVASWTRDLALGKHPTFQPNDYVIVENSRTGEIVSSLNLISQTWTYEGIPFGVGRVELVGTANEYRNRGLVRKQFQVVHEWSRQRGELAQVITGIPYFYRQFGYEMTLSLGGGRIGYEAQLPKLEKDQEEPFAIRPAGEADIAWLMRMYELECRRSMVNAMRSEADWRNEIKEKSRENVNRFDLAIIETREGRPVGYLAYPWYAWGTTQSATRYQLDEDVSYLAVTPTVLRFLWDIGKKNAQERGRALYGFGLWLGGEHPAYTAMSNRLIVRRDPYAFYIRVPDLVGFLRQVGPALENRLKASPFAGHSGEIKLSFYRSGVRLTFQAGKLAGVEAWKPKVREDEGNVSFPDLTFLQMVFGYRTLAEIRYAYPDCVAKDEAGALLDALFPKKHTDLWPIS